jgi:hypothetical protein
MPSPLSSPAIRLYPQYGFSRASRRISPRTERSSGGRPAFRWAYVQRRATSWRVPAQDCLRFDRQVRPSRSRHQATERREQRPISMGQPRPVSTPTQHRQLMTQKQDLELLRATRPRQQPHQREQSPRHQMHERPDQGNPCLDRRQEPRTYPAGRVPRAADEFANPTRGPRTHPLTVNRSEDVPGFVPEGSAQTLPVRKKSCKLASRRPDSNRGPLHSRAAFGRG